MKEKMSVEERAEKLSRVAEMLAEIPPGPLGTEAFNQFARLVPTVVIEAVILRQDSEGRISVLLKKRNENEYAYPGMWHCPGSAIRADELEENALKRMEGWEFNGVKITRCQKVGWWIGPEFRGTYVFLIYLLELADTPTDLVWFLLDDLPENLVAHHREKTIPEAVAFFTKR